MMPFDDDNKKKKTTEQNVTSNPTSPVGHPEVNDTTELDKVDYDFEPDLEGKTATTSTSSLKYLSLLSLLLPLTCCVLAVFFLAR